MCGAKKRNQLELQRIREEAMEKGAECIRYLMRADLNQDVADSMNEVIMEIRRIYIATKNPPNENLYN